MQTIKEYYAKLKKVCIQNQKRNMYDKQKKKNMYGKKSIQKNANVTFMPPFKIL
jgi:hypothetical protein